MTRVTRWPNIDDPGIYRCVCSCGQWQHTGTARQISDAARGHDDSPHRNHVVTILERLDPGTTRRREIGSDADAALREVLVTALSARLAAGWRGVPPYKAADTVLDVLDSLGLYPDWDARQPIPSTPPGPDTAPGPAGPSTPPPAPAPHPYAPQDRDPATLAWARDRVDLIIDGTLTLAARAETAAHEASDHDGYARVDRLRWYAATLRRDFHGLTDIDGRTARTGVLGMFDDRLPTINPTIPEETRP